MKRTTKATTPLYTSCGYRLKQLMASSDYSNTPLPRPSPSRLRKGDAVLRESFPARIAELPFNGASRSRPILPGPATNTLGGVARLSLRSLQPFEASEPAFAVSAAARCRSSWGPAPRRFSSCAVVGERYGQNQEKTTAKGGHQSKEHRVGGNLRADPIRWLSRADDRISSSALWNAWDAAKIG